jgi:hypothetical protein
LIKLADFLAGSVVVPDKWQFLGSREFTAGALVSVLTSIIATFIVDWLKSREFGRVVPWLLKANAALVVLLAVSPYSTFVGSWFMDLLMGVAFAGIYFAVSYMPSTRLQIFALVGPNSLMLVMAWAHTSITGGIAWRSIIASYPMVFVFFTLPVMVGAALVTRRLAKEERMSGPPEQTSAV